MWTKLGDALIECIKEKTGIHNVQLWSGKAEELLRKPHTYPALRVILEKHELTPLDTFGASFNSTFDISILVFFRSLRDAAEGAYPVIEALYWLNNEIVNGYKLRPAGASLLVNEAGEFVFKVSFKAEGREVLYSEEEILVQKITLGDLTSKEEITVPKEG